MSLQNDIVKHTLILHRNAGSRPIVITNKTLTQESKIFSIVC